MLYVDAPLSVESRGDTAIVEGKYLVTKQGQVARITCHGASFQKLRVHSKGYLRCTIFGKDFYVHRLVALCFLPNPNGYLEINHKDGNKENNHAENLEWCTRAQNNRHAFQTGLRNYGELSAISRCPRISRRKYSPADLRAIRKMIDEKKTDREIARIVGGSHGSIYQIRMGKTYREAI